MSNSVQIFVRPSHRDTFSTRVGGLPRGIRFARRLERSQMVVELLEDVDARVIRSALDARLPTAVMAEERHSTSSNNIIDTLLKLVKSKTTLPFVVAPAPAVLRLALARLHNAERELIAHAAIVDKDIRVWSCEPRAFQCPVEQVEALRRVQPKDLGSFSISVSGSRISWPAADVDLVLDDFRQICDPEFARRERERIKAQLVRYGRAIQSMRKAHGLRQTDIQGLSERELRRLESGQHSPRLTTLRILARAHGMRLRAYLDELARRDGVAGNTPELQ